MSETQQLPVDGLAAGVYLIEATDGAYKAYTVAIVTSIAMVERASNGAGRSVCGGPQDRRAGRESRRRTVGRRDGSSRRRRQAADGMASLAMTGARPWGRRRDAERNVWILARHGADAAIVTPWGYSLQAGPATDTEGLHLYRPAGVPAGHTVHIKAVVRAKKTTTRCYCRTRRPSELKVTDADNKTVSFKQDCASPRTGP